MLMAEDGRIEPILCILPILSKICKKPGMLQILVQSLILVQIEDMKGL